MISSKFVRIWRGLFREKGGSRVSSRACKSRYIDPDVIEGRIGSGGKVWS